MDSMPNWEGFITPVLDVLSDGVVRGRSDIYDAVAARVGLTEDQIGEVLGSGQPKYANRIGWALSFLTNVGALSRVSRGHYTITQAGRTALRTRVGPLSERDFKVMARDPSSGITEYVASTKAESTAPSVSPDQVDLDPTEQVEQGIARIDDAVAAELLERLLGNSPTFFEHAVVKLLVAMGYGGAGGAANVTKQSGDGGIDGVIDQDALGLSRVYVQAKRYALDNSVGRPDLQAFVGALSGRADSGVFITTTRFSAGAEAYAREIPARLILIDGSRLVRLMIRYGVGVQVKDTYRVVEIDEDFFE
ncbi:MAG: restriction endonuclease [Mycobacterium sp.]